MLSRQHEVRGGQVPGAASFTEPADNSRLPSTRVNAKSSILNTLLPGLVLWFEAVLIHSSKEASGDVALVIATLGTLGLFFHVPLLVRRFWFRLALGLLCMVFLGRLVFFRPQVVELGFIVVSRSLTIVLAEFLFGWQALVLFRWRFRDPLPILFPGLVLVTCVLTLNRPLSQEVQTIYVLLATGCLLLPALMVNASGNSSRSSGGRIPWSGRFTLAVVCGTMFLGTWTVTQAWSRWLPDAQLWFATQVGRRLDYRYRSREYATSGSLTAIRLQNFTTPNAVALRVQSESRPGYLRGRVFDRYESGVWHIDLNNTRKLEPLEVVPDEVGAPAGNVSVFRIPGTQATGLSRRLTVENDPRRGRVFFTPPGLRYCIGRGDSLVIDEHDVVRAGIRATKPYVALADSFQEGKDMTERRRRTLLKPLRGLGPRVADLAEDVCRRSRTPRDKIRAVRGYFRNNHEYSLQPVDLPKGSDPLNHFLRTRHAAHCELFASGAVALLRLQGVPARYATGYRVLEAKQDYWIARNRDAHAWAEAYDAQRKQWVIVEATPGFTDPTLEDSSELDQEATGIRGRGWAFAAENANSLAQWWKSRPALVRFAIWLLLSLAAGTVIFVYARGFQTAGDAQGSTVADPRLRQWRRFLARMDRRLKHRGLVRHRSETLHQFANRIRALAGDEDVFLCASAEWYVTYARGRFRNPDWSPPALPARSRRRTK
ncbi:MAG: transglutaminase domain-containing protein [Planctomycetota bacterium]